VEMCWLAIRLRARVGRLGRVAAMRRAWRKERR
jgi:hypothetical protein